MPQICYSRVPAVTQITDADCWLASAGMLARYHQDYNVYAKLPKGDFWRKVQNKEGLGHEEAAPLLTAMGFSAVADKPANQTTAKELYEAMVKHGPLWFPFIGHAVVMIGLDTEDDMALILDPQGKSSMANLQRARQMRQARKIRTGIDRDWDSGIWDMTLSTLLGIASSTASFYCLKTGKPPKLPAGAEKQPDVFDRLGLDNPKPDKPTKQPDIFARLGLDAPKSAFRRMP